MVALFLTTTISCSQAFQMLNRIYRNINLNMQQKKEIVQTLREHVPTCPIIVTPDERPKSNS
jgi:hypothetical protein